MWCCERQTDIVTKAQMYITNQYSDTSSMSKPFYLQISLEVYAVVSNYWQLRSAWICVTFVD